MVRPPLYEKLKSLVELLPIRLFPRQLARFNNARLGHPRRVYHGGGGIGDDLFCSTVFRELKKRGESNIVFRTWSQALFDNSPDVDIIIRKRLPVLAPSAIHGLNMFQLTHPRPLPEHVLVHLCRSAGITGEITLRPYIYLRPAELAAGKLADRQIVIQSSGLSALIPSRNKEWYAERFQAVADSIQAKGSLVQIGSASDPPIRGALDLRGKTNLRQSAAILAQARMFIGLEGFLMHLARAVDCRSVIVFGGRMSPSIFGYAAFRNLVGATPCSPCWLDNTCDYDRECMKMISAETVIRAAAEEFELYGQPLAVETARL